jgi:hypothetical protein
MRSLPQAMQASAQGRRGARYFEPWVCAGESGESSEGRCT